MDWNGNGKHDSFDTFMDLKLLDGDLDASTGSGKGKGSGLLKFVIIIFVLLIAGLIADMM